MGRRHRRAQRPGHLRHHVAQHRDAGRGVYPGPDGRGREAQRHHLRRTHPSDIITEVLDAGLLLFGSPTLNNQMFPTMGEFLTYLKGLAPKNKAAAAFGSFGWSGQAVGLITKELEAMKLKVVHEGFKVKYIPDAGELAVARALGEKLARENLKGS